MRTKISKQPRKERRRLFNLPSKDRREQVSSHLAEDLIVKYNTRSVTVRKGDTVKVLRGEYKGTTGKVLEVDTRNRRVTVDGVTITKADHTQKARWVHPSNLLVTKLDLTDARRRAKLGASEADVAEEDRARPKAAGGEKEEEK